ncbi:hypothetical protein INP83_06965 [Mucilaginibacter sp. 21P]|uniref:hypothetical protein n=1 Tax=Mucilaginibacter sp. 21P TaxID=2778902 RepID=UPI001C565E54|nr:hypothetical protein [Mucilaginibacter sp. 21P]QXV66819.1 hypothetical protein INP83_06965 [Mucilaginibacter sp. 21P]
MKLHSLLYKRCLFVLALFIFLLGCKKKDQPAPVESIPPAITGTLYSKAFTAKVSLERYTNFSMNNYRPDDLFAIYVSDNSSKNCSSKVNEFAMRLTVPKKVGTFSNGDTYILVNDPADQTGTTGILYANAQSSITITSITNDKVSGYVNIINTENNIDVKGRFEATYCK